MTLDYTGCVKKKNIMRGVFWNGQNRETNRIKRKFRLDIMTARKRRSINSPEKRKTVQRIYNGCGPNSTYAT